MLYTVFIIIFFFLETKLITRVPRHTCFITKNGSTHDFKFEMFLVIKQVCTCV